MNNKVTVLLAIYKPNILFLKKQLKSLDLQSHENLEIYLLDDSEDFDVYNSIQSVCKEVITLKKYTILRNEKNIGSNKTFEELTRICNGDYFAYCDQDDIWEVDKITKQLDKINLENSLLCYSDLSIIDSQDDMVSNSFKQIRKRLKHVYGENKYDFFLRRNSATGCTILVNAYWAKKALPFAQNYVHDHWLLLYISAFGRISYIEEPLVRYRIHENNQIGSAKLGGIENKSDYYVKRLEFEKVRLQIAEERFCGKSEVLNKIKILKNRIYIRIQLFENPSLRNLFKYMKIAYFDFNLFLFETSLFMINDKKGRQLISLMRKSTF